MKGVVDGWECSRGPMLCVMGGEAKESKAMEGVAWRAKHSTAVRFELTRVTPIDF